MPNDAAASEELNEANGAGQECRGDLGWLRRKVNRSSEAPETVIYITGKIPFLADAVHLLPEEYKRTTLIRATVAAKSTMRLCYGDLVVSIFMHDEQAV